LLEAGFHLLGIGDIHFYGHGFAARGCYFADEQGQFFFAARGNGDSGASNYQRLRDVPSNSLGGAGYQSDFIFQTEHLQNCSLKLLNRDFAG
jgi:hypothetical protein